MKIDSVNIDMGAHKITAFRILMDFCNLNVTSKGKWPGQGEHKLLLLLCTTALSGHLEWRLSLRVIKLRPDEEYKSAEPNLAGTEDKG
jgi:hypothetical protein